jgi:signal recognition particle subunit SRP68
MEKPANALALYARALELALAMQPSLPSSPDEQGPPTLDILPEQVKALVSVVRALVAQYRGLVTLESLSASKEDALAHQAPLIERMDEYSGDSIDLGNLVPYPLKMQPIPVKPLFLDVAWNYVDYPRSIPAQSEPPATVEEKKDVRRGWFGFGR